ncbi:MAG: hypothetical protein J1F41_11340, partial [Lachnospiraceae bacterium]|nr:hypothetical protein [Lachnospiraceae bacterium]
MSRDFEQEFKELKQSEIPDLWNRIEAGLSERPMTVPHVTKKIAWRRWGTLAAACLGVAIILPALTFFLRNNGERSGTSAEDTTAAPSTAAAPADTAAAEEWEAEDAAVADDVRMNGEAYTGMAESADAITAEPAEAETDDGATDEAIKEDADAEDDLQTPTQGKEMAKNDPYAAIKEGQVLEGIVLQITEAENTNASV